MLPFEDFLKQSKEKADECALLICKFKLPRYISSRFSENSEAKVFISFNYMFSLIYFYLQIKQLQTKKLDNPELIDRVSSLQHQLQQLQEEAHGDSNEEDTSPVKKEVLSERRIYIPTGNIVESAIKGNIRPVSKEQSGLLTMTFTQSFISPPRKFTF